MAKKTAVCLNMKMQQTYQVNLEIGKCTTMGVTASYLYWNQT